MAVSYFLRKDDFPFLSSSFETHHTHSKPVQKLGTTIVATNAFPVNMTFPLQTEHPLETKNLIFFHRLILSLVATNIIRGALP